MDEVITRFAPSPTGFLHIGGIRTALINYIYTNQAKKNFPNSKFFLRIEDTDKIRSKNEYLESITNGLQWLGIKWDETITIQSKKIDIHKRIALKLLQMNSAYKCICSPEKLEQLRKENLKKNISIKRLCKNCESNDDIQNLKNDYCIRIKIPENGNLSLNDMIQGEIKINNQEIDNYILLRKDGTPTYMLSVVVDDHDMNVNTIIRGNDHLNNTFRQAYIYKHLGWKIPNYAHLPLIYGTDKTKLSKRHGAVDINEFNKIGYLPEAIINNLILLGWSPKNKNEVINLEEIVNKFNIEQLSKSPSVFDYQKLDFFNNYYLQTKEGFDYMIKYINKNDQIKSEFSKNRGNIIKIYNIYKTKVKNISNMVDIINIYDDNFIIKPNNILSLEFNNLLKQFKSKLEKIQKFNDENIENCIEDFLKNKEIKFSSFGKPMRYLLTNTIEGPSISVIISLLGKEKTFTRINNYINT